MLGHSEHIYKKKIAYKSLLNDEAGFKEGLCDCELRLLASDARRCGNSTMFVPQIMIFVETSMFTIMLNGAPTRFLVLSVG